LWKFLFEGRCEHLQLEFASRETSASLQAARKASMEVLDLVTCGTPTLAFGSDCVLLKALSTPIPDLNIGVLDPTTTSPSHDLAKKKRVEYNLNRHFQDH
jgi:hypothetical protein